MTKLQKKLYDKQWYKLNRKAKLVNNKHRYKIDLEYREKIKQNAKKWILANLEHKTQYNKTWYQNNKHKLVEYNLKCLYNLSLSQLAQMHKRQQNKCLICERKRRLIIDHDHKTGKVRGLLCYTCNTHLGWFENTIVKTNLDKYLKGEHNGAITSTLRCLYLQS